MNNQIKEKLLILLSVISLAKNIVNIMFKITARIRKRNAIFFLFFYHF